MTKITGPKVGRGLGQKFPHRRHKNGQQVHEKGSGPLTTREAPVKTPRKYNIPSNRMTTVKTKMK